MRKSLLFLIIIIIVVSIPLALAALSHMVNILPPTDPSNPTRLLDFTSSNTESKKNTLLDCVNYYEDLFSEGNKTGTLMISKDYRQGFFVDLCETGYKDSDGTYTHLLSEDLQQQYYNLTKSKILSSIFR